MTDQNIREFVSHFCDVLNQLNSDKRSGMEKMSEVTVFDEGYMLCLYQVASKLKSSSIEHGLEGKISELEQLDEDSFLL